MAGRRKPIALKKAAGNPGKRKLPENEPVATGKAVPPRSLTPKARTVWDRVAPRLDKLGVLAAIDTEVLERYCETQARWRELNKWLQAKGNDGTEAGRIHPKANLCNRLAIELLKAECEFGMTPASRTRIAVAPQKDGAESIEAFAGRKPKLQIAEGA